MLSYIIELIISMSGGIESATNSNPSYLLPTDPNAPPTTPTK